MIYTFRLSKISANPQTFTIGKELVFNKMRIKAITLDDPDKTTSPLIGANEHPIYLTCDKWDNDDIIFNNGKTASITAGGTKILPITTIATAIADTMYAGLNDVCVIDRLTTFSATDTITWAFKELDGTGTILTNCLPDVIFGADVQDADASLNPDRGINIICEFELERDNHHYGGDVAIADDI